LICTAVFCPAQDLDNQVTDLRRQHRAKLNEEKLHNKELHHQIESVQEQIQELQTQMKVQLLLITWRSSFLGCRAESTA
jgi:uncharacterized protein involved in exopolysaccharide biosynthesis